MLRKRRKEVVKLGKLEGKDLGSLAWKSKDKSLSWDFVSYVPILLRDALKNLAANLQSCPHWMVEDSNNDIELACDKWRNLINSIANKLDYASKVDYAIDYLPEEDKNTLLNYYCQNKWIISKEDIEGNVEHVLADPPENIKNIMKKEDSIVEDMHTKLKEALKDLGEIWYDLWD